MLLETHQALVAHLDPMASQQSADAARNDFDAGEAYLVNGDATVFTPGRESLTEAEFELPAYLQGLSNPDRLKLEGLDGLFCASIAGPDLVMPSEHVPVVWDGEFADEDVFESESEAQELLGLLKRHRNSIINEFEREGVYDPSFGPPDARGVPGRC